jgi:hypothetical protein
MHRLKVRFPVASTMLLFHQDIDSWVERSNIATRSHINFDELPSPDTNPTGDINQCIDKIEQLNNCKGKVEDIRDHVAKATALYGIVLM